MNIKPSRIRPGSLFDVLAFRAENMPKMDLKHLDMGRILEV
jgi:hypothetical protein